MDKQATHLLSCENGNSWELDERFPGWYRVNREGEKWTSGWTSNYFKEFETRRGYTITPIHIELENE